MDIYQEVMQERNRQDQKWGGPKEDDRRKSETDWVEDIEAYLAWAKQMHRMGSPEKYRRRMMQIAALAVAACESYDRKAAAAAGALCLVQDFIQAACNTGEGHEVVSTTLYDAFREYCHGNGWRRYHSLKAFSVRLAELGFPRVKREGRIFWQRIALAG